ncbi:hypothetical protein [Nocardioides dilutus]
MNSKTTRRPRLGLVVGAVALGVACTGGAYAAGAQITSSAQIKSQVVNSGDIKNGTVKLKDLNPKTVTKVKQLEAWHVASLQGSWATFPARNAPAFRADEVNGVVHLRGAASFGSDNGSDKTIFSLPAGYRPATPITVNVATFNGLGGESEFGALEIQTDGDVRIYGSGDDRFVSFEGVSFSIG